MGRRRNVAPALGSKHEHGGIVDVSVVQATDDVDSETFDSYIAKIACAYMMGVVSLSDTIRCVSGDLFASTARILVIPVNCVGRMGKGVALVIRERFPLCEQHYRGWCETGEVAPGRCRVWSHPSSPDHDLLLFPTKRHWRDNARRDDLISGLGSLRSLLLSTPADTRIAIPALGCGNGGLEWSDVQPLILTSLADVGRPIDLYLPQEVP
jgi:O-acetyl-ADP-ribose deacetylase (regulator of RNase III)